MIRKNQRILNFFNALTDGILVLFVYVLSSWLWLDVVRGTNNMASVSGGKTVLVACVYALVIVLLLALMRMYNTSRTRRLRMEIFVVFEVNGLGIIAVGALLYLFRLEDFSRGVLGMFFVLNSLAMSAKRVALHWLLVRMRARGFNQKHVIIVGTGHLARQYAADVRKEPGFGFHLMGLIGAPTEGEKYLGGFDQLEQHLQGTDVDEVVVALEPEETAYVSDIIMTCEKCGTKVSIVPFYNDIIPASPTIECIGQTKLINLRANPLDNLGLAVIKRLFDTVVSALLLLILSPLFLAVVVGIKLSSPGPILFKQERVGRGKKHFTMLKFRSMRVNAKEQSGWTTNNDPRKTRFGSFLRKFSIDELPQLINVFRGDMSLIGPRPEVPFYVEQFKDSVPLYMVKHQVRPGMTGWAQVNGYRGDTSIVKRIEYDVWYIENWSIRLDLKILWMTFWGGWMNKEQLVKAQEPAKPAAKPAAPAKPAQQTDAVRHARAAVSAKKRRRAKASAARTRAKGRKNKRISAAG